MINRRQSGFTLLEVLVAFVILSLVLAVILQIFSTNLQASSKTEHYTRAMVVAKSKLASVGKEITVVATESSGQEGVYTWRLSIVPHELSSEDEQTSEDFRLYQVNLTVAGPGTGRNVELQLTTLRLARI